MKFFTTLLAVVSLGDTVHGASFRGGDRMVWTKKGDEGENHSQLVQVNHNKLMSTIGHALAAEDDVSLTFDFFDGEVDCTLRRSSVMHPDLAAKYPEIISMSGVCEDEGTSVSLTLDVLNEGSFSATIHHKAGFLFFVDHDPEQSSDIDTFYLHVPKHNSESFGDVAFLLEGFRRHLEEVQDLSTVVTPWQHRQLASLQAYKFRLAISTTATYSAYHGNTVQKVLTAINTAMARVNGITLRELGVMFELISNTDDLICLEGQSDCAHLENNVNVLFQSGDFIASRGVNKADYDIGHTFSTQSGGSSVVTSLCWEPYKHMAASGWGTQPTGNDYYLLIAHEFGHQMSAGHTFRDCEGANDANMNANSAIEPGSGSSLMSYPGFCTDSGTNNNLQAVKDPYYNSGVLVGMRSFVEARVAGGCGEAVSMSGAVKPVMTSVDTCRVPKGNYVQLSGSIENKASLSGSTYVAWDRIDPGYEDYTDTTVARFAPLTPSTRSMARFLPNMYVLSFNPNQKAEIAPTNGGGNQEMKFRFIGRTKYRASTTVSNFDVAMAGTFGYHDLTLTYDDSIAPLKLTNAPSSLSGGSQVTISWSGGTSANVELLVALNTMTRVSNPNFDNVLDDLDFVSMGVFSNSAGSARVTVPQLSNPNNLPVNLMIRSGPNECYFFDLVAGITYSTVSTAASPTAAPVAPPTNPPKKKKNPKLRRH